MKFNFYKFLTTRLLLFAAVFAFVLLFSPKIIVSPSHPFVDDNNNGIDDFEEKRGEYADPAIRAKIYGVTFPIDALGDCKDYNECRSFCEDPVNSTACVAYGKERGFYKDDPVVSQRDKIMDEARRGLGCDSLESCMNFCEVPANFDKCSSFAKRQGIVGGVIDDPGRGEIINKAKEVLGCDSENSCKSVCMQQDNIDKCKAFAETVGIRGGEHRVGPGGCQSEATCKSFCSDPNNFQVCRGFSEVSGGNFQGPGGCNSPEGCFKYCKDNPKDCGYKEGEDPGKGIAPGGGFYNPVEMCNRTPNCSWTADTCSCGYFGETKETMQKAAEYAGFCQANPDQCKPGERGVFGDSQRRQEFEDFCKQNPDKCKPPAEQASEQAQGRYGGYFGKTMMDPATECGRYGCSWTGSSCQCTSSNVRSYTPPAYTEQNPQASCSSGGCKWTGSGCDCSSVSQDSPALACGKQPGCSWINSSCQCSGTGGAGSGGVSAPGGYTPPVGVTSQGWMPASQSGPAPTGYSGGSGNTYTPPSAGSYSPGSYNQGNYTPPGSYTPQTYTAPQTSTQTQPQTYTAPQTQTQPQTQAQPQPQEQPQQQQSQPAPAPAQESAPQPQQQQSAPQPAPAEPAPQSAPAPAVQGISAFRNIINRMLGL